MLPASQLRTHQLRGVTLLVITPLFVSTLVAGGQPADSAMATPTTSPAADELATTFATEQRQALKQMLTDAPVTQEQSFDSLLKFDVSHGRLLIDLVDTNGPELRVFTVGGNQDHVFFLQVNKLPTNPPIVTFRAHSLRYEPAANRSLDIDVQPVPNMVNFSISIQTPTGTAVVQMIDQGPRIFDGEGEGGAARLYLQRTSDTGERDAESEGRFNFVEASFGEIIEKHHDDAFALLGEGLTAMRAMHVMAGVGHDEARAIFDADREIDDPTKRELAEIVDAIRQNGAAALSDARPRLRKLGASAAMALTKMPRDGWSADLALNVDALAAGLLPAANERSGGLLSSPSRLVDLLYSPDVSIRRDAKARLASALKKSIQLDVAVDPYTQIAAIEALRPKAPTPTTRQ